MKYILASLFFTVLLISCDTFFESTLVLEQPEVPPNMTFNVYVNDDPFLWNRGIAHVSSTFGLNERIRVISSNLDEAQPFMVRNAEVSIKNLENGEVYLFEELPELDEIFGYELEKPDGFPAPLVEYELKIEHPDFPTTTARQVMPEKVEVKKAEFVADTGIDEDGNETSGVEVTFHDTPGLNFYVFSMNSIGTYAARNEYLLINDELFEGQEHTVLINFDKIDSADFLTVDIQKINEAQYRYLLTVNKTQEIDDNPFQTPVQIYSNGSNGFGILSMNSIISVPIE